MWSAFFGFPYPWLLVLVPLLLANRTLDLAGQFVDGSLIVVVVLSVLVFSFFNFRPKNKAKCFAGDAGASINWQGKGILLTLRADPERHRPELFVTVPLPVN